MSRSTNFLSLINRILRATACKQLIISTRWIYHPQPGALPEQQLFWWVGLRARREKRGRWRENLFQTSLIRWRPLWIPRSSFCSKIYKNCWGTTLKKSRIYFWITSRKSLNNKKQSLSFRSSWESRACFWRILRIIKEARSGREDCKIYMYFITLFFKLRGIKSWGCERGWKSVNHEK